MASAVNALDIDAIRNRLSAVTGRAGRDVLHAEPLDVDQLAVLDDPVDQPGNMRRALPIGVDPVDFGHGSRRRRRGKGRRRKGREQARQHCAKFHERPRGWRGQCR